MRGPEALCPRSTGSGIFERTLHGVTFLQRDGDSRRVQVAHARAAATAGHNAGVWGIGIRTAANTGQRPTQLRQQLCRGVATCRK